MRQKKNRKQRDQKQRQYKKTNKRVETKQQQRKTNISEKPNRLKIDRERLTEFVIIQNKYRATLREEKEVR